MRGFTQDDAHILCTPEQIVKEIKDTVNFAKAMLGKFGFHDIQAYLSTKPEKAVGDSERWEEATNSLRAALDEVLCRRAAAAAPSFRLLASLNHWLLTIFPSSK